MLSLAAYVKAVQPLWVSQPFIQPKIPVEVLMVFRVVLSVSALQ